MAEHLVGLAEAAGNSAWTKGLAAHLGAMLSSRVFPCQVPFL
jgi:hypothetical protein